MVDSLKTLLNSFRGDIKPERQNGTLGYNEKDTTNPVQFFPYDIGRRSFLSERFCARVFRILIPLSNPEHGLTSETLNERVQSYCKKVFGDPGLRVILSILLWYGDAKDAQRLTKFQENFLEGNSKLNDSDLPFDQRSAEELFGDGAKSMFFNCQYEFLASTLQAGHFRQVYHSPTILPWSSGAKLGEGAYGKVYKVKIARGHFIVEEPRTRNADVSGLSVELNTRSTDTDDTTRR